MRFDSSSEYREISQWFSRQKTIVEFSGWLLLDCQLHVPLKDFPSGMKFTSITMIYNGHYEISLNGNIIPGKMDFQLTFRE